MTESSSNSNLNSEDSFTNLFDSKISLMSESVESAVTSTPQSTDANSLNVEELQKKLMKEIFRNALLQAKVELIEDKNEKEIKTLINEVKKANELNIVQFKKNDDLTLKIDKLEEKVVTKEDFFALINKNAVLFFELKQLKEGKIAFFVHVSNKWKDIHSQYLCCEKKCVNTDNPDVFCMNGNGFIQIKSDTNVKYIKCRKEKGDNKIAVIIAENRFNNPNKNSATLFYYEVKLQSEEKNAMMAIGLEKDDWRDSAALHMTSEISFNCFQKDNKMIELTPFSSKNDDIIGCGLVYPPPKFNYRLPYVFFTQNGKQIGKAILLKDNFEYYLPYIDLKCCSVITNFGDKPFLYDISQHYLAEEFYKDEEWHKNMPNKHKK